MTKDLTVSPSPVDRVRRGEREDLSWESERVPIRERVLRNPAGQSDLPDAAVRRCCCELCDAPRCAVDARNARTMIAILVVAMRLRVWERVKRSAISISMGARWVPGHCACLAQPGQLVCFHLVLAVASIVS